jgi:2-keto-4-pentenoate hydratase/2-oxohepta-3-ene-1,7-dioic acid hydratase in catechol pathway
MVLGGSLPTSAVAQCLQARSSPTSGQQRHPTTSAAAEPLKLATYRSRQGGETRVGVVRGDRIGAAVGVRSMLELVTASGSSRPTMQLEQEDTTSWARLSEVQLLPPLPPGELGQVICVGKNYAEHVKEVDSALPGISQLDAPEHPIIFTKAASAVVGHGDTIPYPHGLSEQLDYEGELAVVIGKGGKAITAEDAHAHVFGYTVLNDVTARDVQKRHQQWFLGKSMQGFCPMGPWLVPAADVPHLASSLQLRTWVNGELRQDASTHDMIFDVPTLIAVVSAAVCLAPGDVIATGTPAGVGAGFTPPRFLRPGDVVRVAIAGIGELENTVG